jgi:uncharacterized protein YhaN
MRLLRLELKAFGPFTDRVLHFSTEAPGLHVIYGPNEAGKSSSLRAVKALLYGFPVQTPDNFRHSYDQLLVAGTLRNRAGAELSLQRRKKRLGDLLDAAGEPLDHAALAPFLGGVEASLFASLFGIDHDTLVRGGEEILAQKGELGQALFAAGAGLSSLSEVIVQLDQEAGELFKPVGQRPALNTAIRIYRELQTRARAAALSAREWQEQRQALDQAMAERARQEEERDRLNAELHRLERLRQAVPELAALQAWRGQLRALGEVVFLPPDFAERYARVSREMRETGQQLHRDSERLGLLRQRREAIAVNRELLARADVVDDFHQRLGEYRKGQKDRLERNGMRISLRSEAARLLQQLRPDLPLEEVESLRYILVKKRTVQALSSRYEAISQRLALAQRQGALAEREYRQAEAGLAATKTTVDPQPLLLALKPVQQAGDLDGLLARCRDDIGRRQEECRAELQRLGLWRGGLVELMTLPLPLPATIERFAQTSAELGEKKRELDRVRQSCTRERQSVRGELDRLESAGAVPREEELFQVRQKREEGWQLLRRQWLLGEEVGEESLAYAALPLPEAYQGYVGRADQLADRLRWEADRVAGAAALGAQLTALEREMAENARAEESLHQQNRNLDEAWREVWQPLAITPLPPREMHGWLGAIHTLRFKVAELDLAERECARQRRQREELRATLAREVAALGEDGIPAGPELAPLVALAESLLARNAEEAAQLARLREKREKAASDRQQAAADCQAAESALAQWREEWRKALAGLSDRDQLTTLEAVDLFDILQSCLDKVREADDLKKRIDGIDRDAALLEGEVRALLTTVAPALQNIPLEPVILQLRTMLAMAQQEAALDNQLSGELRLLEEEVQSLAKKVQGARAEMDELQRLATCREETELPAVIERCGEEKRLREKIAAAEENLARIGAGTPLPELARQAALLSIDALPGQIEALQRDLGERVYPGINRISQVIGELETRLAAMDGGAKAAELAEEMEQVLAGIRRQAERYAMLKVAARLLQQVIERYREEHQDPVLALASRSFQDLTLGSFAGLRADRDDRGQAVLVGVRPDGVRLTVEKMSSGTRDQLFLALRLASLEWRLRAEEPMPFVVDDILINFDDARARATLAALAELAKENQVLLFTHHLRIVEEAGRIPAAGIVEIHELAPR